MNFKSQLLWIFVVLMFLGCNRDKLKLKFSKLELVSNTTIDSSRHLIISKPVVIELFFMAKRFQKANYSDTILSPIERWIEKNRNSYYSMVDCYSYHISEIEPLLDTLSIKHFEPPQNIDYITFINNENHKFTIKVNDYQNNDGLIIFNGNHSPLYWESIYGNITIYNFLKSYFDEE